MKNKFFITLALLAGVSYVAAQLTDDPQIDEWGMDVNQDTTWGPFNETDNPNVDEWGPDVNPGDKRVQTKRSAKNNVDDMMTDDVDTPGVDDQWGLDQ